MKRALPLIFLMLAACSPEPTVDQQIIGTIRAMETHAEAGEPGPFMDYVADDFQGQNGGLTRDEFRAYMLLQLNQYRRLHAQLMPISVTELEPGQAEARFHALITGGKGLIPEQGQLMAMTTGWTLERGDWLLVSAEWERITD